MLTRGKASSCARFSPTWLSHLAVLPVGKWAWWKLSSSTWDLKWAPAVYWGGNLFQEAMCGLGQHYLRLGKQTWLCHILTEQERKGKSGVERALDLAAAVWS